MATLKYLKVSTNQQYSPEAWGYVTGSKVKPGIIEAAKWTVSAGAIAGAMVEERMDYGSFQHMVDYYAQYGAPLSHEQIEEAMTNPNFVEVGFDQLILIVDPAPRSQNFWETEYASVKDSLDSVHPSRLDKWLHPSLIDAGPSNMRIAVAIRLVNKNAATYQGYELSRYLDPNDGYVKLVDDLMNNNHELAAHLYGLYLKEAENWFKSPEINAYNGQWDLLPQEFRDALLVTFVNKGEQAMLDARNALYTSRGLPYEPLPAMTVGAGMNHLYNAAAMGSHMGFAGYGAEVEGVQNFEQDALIPGDSGLAYRYALYRLRYVALSGLDYSAYNQNGELDIVDPATGKGDMSKEYIHDRTMMLDRLTYLRMQPGVSVKQLNYQDDTGIICYYDAAQTITIATPGIPTVEENSTIQFGDAGKNTLTGRNGFDHLYGMSGNDEIYGNDGDDYIEGGRGWDNMYGGDGNDTFHVEGDDPDKAFDNFNGGAGEDTIEGGTGDDVIRVRNFADMENGEDQRVEVIDGKGGVNVLSGTDEGDRIDLSETELRNIREIRLEASDDTLKLGEKQHDGKLTLIDGGSGEDTITHGGKENLLTDTNLDIIGVELRGIENIVVSEGDYKLNIRDVTFDTLTKIEFKKEDETAAIQNVTGGTIDEQVAA